VAVKITRQPNKIILLGSPTSAAVLSAGHEGAPAALRSAGIVDRFHSIGYEVEDFGDDPIQLSKPDEESPRARNISGVLASINSLKPRVELAVKAAALPVILSGDCSVALATVAAVRRYFRNVGLIYMDRDADLNTPATTQTGSLDGMVVSHITGRGAAELVRFWSEPPLVRDPDVALFGVVRVDPPEQELLERSTLRRYLAAEVRKSGAAAAARAAVERIHGDKNEFVLHFDVDVISGFAATNYPAEGGLSLEEVREALEVFVTHPHLAAMEVTAYNPAKDPDGSAAKAVIDLLANVLEKRLDALKSPQAPAETKPVKEEKPEVESATAPAVEPSAAAPDTTEAAKPPAAPEEAGSSDSGEETRNAPPEPSHEGHHDAGENSGGTSESDS
jgi:arginase